MTFTHTFLANLFNNLLFVVGQFLGRISSSDKLAAVDDDSIWSSTKMRATVYPNGVDHLMEISIGTPPVKVRGVLDTGSSLVWSRCATCVDCAGRHEIFHPQFSATYRNVTCESSSCKEINPAAACDNGGTFTCPYMYEYGDASFTSGVVATEVLTFDTVDGGIISFPNVAFGCGSNNSASFDDQDIMGIGVFGLGGGPSSLISQLSPNIEGKFSIGGKFSYCLVPFHENTSTGVMRFGENSVISGPSVVSTPLISGEDPTYYFVTLESISVAGGSKMIQVPDEVDTDAAAKSTGNMFIDCGTTDTLLNTDVFNRLSAELTNVVRLPPTTDPGETFLCYHAGSRDRFPEITFHFDGGADLKLQPFNTFTVPSPEGLVCLAMQPTNEKAILGNRVQQNFLIAYDLVARRVSFKPTECAKFN